MGHHPQAAGKGGPTVLSTAGGQLPCPHQRRVLWAPLLGAVSAGAFRSAYGTTYKHGRVPPGIGHHPQVVKDTYPWGACLGLSVTSARQR